MRKGVATGSFLLVVTVILVAVIVGYIGSLVMMKVGVKENVENQFTMRHEIHTMDNALKGAKVYMMTAQRYSLYQASYDVFRQGCLPEQGAGGTYNYWSGGAVKVLTAQEVNSALETKTTEYLNRYSAAGYNFMTDFKVSIPSYQVNLDSDLETFSLASSSDSNMVISRKEKTGESITLEAKPALDDKVTLSLKGLYDEGVKTLPAVQQELQSGIAGVSLPQTCADSYTANSAEKEALVKDVMGISLSSPAETDDYSYEVKMVYADAARSPGTPCKQTVLGVAKVKITAKKVMVPVINENKANFAPVELVYLVGWTVKATGDAPDLGVVTPTNEMKIPAPVVPVVVNPAGTSGGTTDTSQMPASCKSDRTEDDIDDFIDEASSLFDIPPEIIRAVICKESAFNPTAGSPVGASGLMQFMQGTFDGIPGNANCIAKASEKGIVWSDITSKSSSRTDPYQSIMRGTCYLYSNRQGFSNLQDPARWRCALAAYNAGPGAVTKENWDASGCEVSSITYPETRTYVAKITEWSGLA